MLERTINTHWLIYSTDVSSAPIMHLGTDRRTIASDVAQWEALQAHQRP